MNDIAQIILSIATLVTAIGTVVLGVINRSTIKTLQHQTNGMLHRMEEMAEAKGKVEGHAEERAAPSQNV